MHRLFVAIRPPAPIRLLLTDMMGGVHGARWQDDDQLHITLRFIGEVDGRVADDIVSALRLVTMAPFDLALDGIGQFDRRGRTDALWIGVRPHDRVATLHRKVDQALQRVGLPPEGRAYLPHITMARFGRECGPIDRFIAQAADGTGAHFAVDHFALFESDLGNDGSSYTIIERYPLG